MKRSTFLVSAIAALVPVAFAQAFTMDITSAVGNVAGGAQGTNAISIPFNSASGSTLILQMRVHGSADQTIVEGQGQMTVPLNGQGSPGLTFATASSTVNSYFRSQYGSTNPDFGTLNGSPATFNRGATAFTPANTDDGQGNLVNDPDPMKDGILFENTLTIAAGTLPGVYIIGNPTFSKFVAPDASSVNPSQRGVFTLTILAVPEPATGLLLLGSLAFLRRRKA